jgi:hypothetical protein
MRAPVILTPTSRTLLVVAHRSQADTDARTQQKIRDNQSARRQCETEPIDQGQAIVAVTAEGENDRDRQAGARTAAKGIELAGDQHQDLGDDPGADRQVRGAQAEHEGHRRHRNQKRHEAGERDRHYRVEAEERRAAKESIGPDANKTVLADRHDIGIAGQ